MEKYFTVSNIVSTLIKLSLIVIFGVILSGVLGFSVGFKQLQFMTLLVVVILILSWWRAFIRE